MRHKTSAAPNPIYGGINMVHQYQLNNYNIVLDTCSGSVHSVDDVAYDIISMYGQLIVPQTDTGSDDAELRIKTGQLSEKGRRQIITAIMEKYGHRDDVTEADIAQCIDDIESLIADGKLFSPDTFADMAGTFKERSGDVVKALCLHVAHTCNLNCSYCFASQGKYHGDRALMPFEVGKQALDFLMDNSGSRTNLEGGQGTGKLCPAAGRPSSQKFPLYPDHQRHAHRRRCDRFC